MHPGSEPPRTNPILYVILLIAVGNLVLTASLWMNRESAPQGPEPVARSSALPAYLDDAGLEGLASELSRLFNSEDYDAFYERFDPLAKVQFSRADLESQVVQFRDLLGRIEASAYERHESGTHGDFPAYHIYYKVRLSGGPFSQGELRISIIDRGDRLGVFGFFIKGASG